MNRNYSDISYAESPFGTLSEFMSKTFGWMFAGLLVTFLVGIGAVTTGLIYPLITSGLFILTSIAELVLVFVLSARVQTLQPSTATGIFFAYAVLNGLNLSSIFLAYDFGSLILAFLVGAVYFGGDAAMLHKSSIIGALNLYLDFINIFLYILRMLGRRSND